MGLLPEFVTFIDNSIVKAFSGRNERLKMLELGNQLTPKGVSGKQIYSEKGFLHTSVDINGMDGSLPKDLRDSAQFSEWFEEFDVITNSGTTEHVEPHATQYEAFKIIHNCVSPMGLMVHIVPDVFERDERNHWIGHCSNYYSPYFFRMLARENYYEIIEDTVIFGLRSVAMVKKVGCSFMNDKNKFLSEVAIR
jgi:hypothetical protein